MRKKYLLLLFISIVGRVWGQLPSIDLSFNTGAGYGGDINDIVLQPDGKIITTGRFKYIDNTTRYYIARLNYNGSIDSTFIPSGNIFGNNYGWRLNKAVLQPDGKIIIGGYFFSVEGVNRNYIARLNDNGSLDTTFASSGIGFVSYSCFNTSNKLSSKRLSPCSL